MSETTAPWSPRRRALDRVEEVPALTRLWREVRRRAGGDAAHDPEHLLRVAGWTVRLGGSAVEPTEAVAAGLLHDLVLVPKDAPDRAEAGVRSAEAARGLLAEQGFDAASAERIAAAVRDHGYSRGATPDDALGRALQDADRLEALGALGVLRAAATGAGMGAGLVDGRDPWARDRELDDRTHTVDHFFTKLLRLPSRMNTEAGRAEAERRAARMRRFLAELGEELGEAAPFDERGHGA